MSFGVETIVITSIASMIGAISTVVPSIKQHFSGRNKNRDDAFKTMESIRYSIDEMSKFSKTELSNREDLLRLEMLIKKLSKESSGLRKNIRQELQQS